MLVSRMQPVLFQEEQQDLCGWLGRDFLPFGGVRTWTRTPSLTLWSRTEPLKPIGTGLVLFRQLRENLNFFTRLRRSGEFLQLEMRGAGCCPPRSLCNPSSNVSYSLLHSLLRCLQILCGRTLGFKNLEQLPELSHHLVLWKLPPSVLAIWHS